MNTPPLAFTEDNFNAVIRGDKTETRRLLTIPKLTQQVVNEFESFNQDGNGDWIGWIDGDIQGIKSRLQIGDRAYLKEPTEIISDLESLENLNAQVAYIWDKKDWLWQRLTEADLAKIKSRKSGIHAKQSQMFMLKSFSRHSVEILDVRVERLMDITDEGAIAEGILKPRIIVKNGVTALNFYDYMTGNYTRINDPKGSYFSEIAYIHKKSGGWDLVKSNPWLWVYKFRYVRGD